MMRSIQGCADDLNQCLDGQPVMIVFHFLLIGTAIIVGVIQI